MKNSSPIIMWFRNDLRLSDNPALNAAYQSGFPIMCLFLWSTEESKEWSVGAASQWWLHQSLHQLDQDLKKYGNGLVIRKGNTMSTLKEMIKETGAHAVFWNCCYEPLQHVKDRQITQMLEAMNVSVHTFNGSLLFEPQKLLNKSGLPYRVFTPFWKACLQNSQPETPLPAPMQLPAPAKIPYLLSLSALNLEPTIDWDAGIRATWSPGEKGAHTQLQTFLHDGLIRYQTDRDRPDLTNSSRLSPHLHFGEVSPRQIWQSIITNACSKQSRSVHRSATAYLRQLGWREFAYHLLHYHPHTPTHAWRQEFEEFPWIDSDITLRAWQKGKTGYPLVDAGMRELWVTGWMHNRVRMVAASFLVKHLLIPWQRGAEWFWDTLVDADLANNTLGWQWVAGCGADAAPYFRIFNPIIQGMKFDPQGNYVRRWIPALAKLPAPWIHKPWEAPTLVLEEAGIKLGQTYPQPIVHHEEARERALNAYTKLRTIRFTNNTASSPDSAMHSKQRRHVVVHR